MFYSIVYAQTTPPKIYLNCQHARCYDDYVHELSFFEFVRDRYQSDIEVLIVSQTTGAGGRNYTLTFLGHNAFKTKSDTLNFNTRQTDTEDMVRKSLLKTIKQGLVLYLVDTDLFQEINFAFPKRKLEEKTTQTDRWNYWVFNMGGNGNINGESNKKYLSLNSSFRVSRVSPASKFIFSGYHNQNKNQFIVDGEEIKVKNISMDFLLCL
ncbi:MAG: hypothetical protein R2822_08000 [Spirosomataceae bacterium]